MIMTELKTVCVEVSILENNNDNQESFFKVTPSGKENTLVNEKKPANASVEKLKQNLLPVICAKLDRLLQTVCDEETERRNLLPEKAKKVYKLFMESVKEQFNVSEQWDNTFSEMSQTLGEEYWEDAMKHHAFLLLQGIISQKQGFLVIFDYAVQRLDEEEKKAPGNNGGQKPAKH